MTCNASAHAVPPGEPVPLVGSPHLPGQRTFPPNAENPVPVAGLTLDARGLIDDCDSTAEQMFGYQREQLLGHPVSLVLPELLEGTLCQDGKINSWLIYRSHIGAFFWARSCSGECFPCLIFVSNIGSPSAPHIRIMLRRRLPLGALP